MFSLSRLVVLVAVVIPFAAATDCASGSFFFSSKASCMPVNGHLSADAMTPPSGCSCPVSKGNWYFSRSEQHCAPSNPAYTESCPTGFEWSPNHTACIKSTPPQTPSECSKTEFWWSERSCCLPSGPTATPVAPSGSKCPSTGWGWTSKYGCCAPQSPPSSQPTCPGGWVWMADIHQCQPQRREPPKPAPSGSYSYGKRVLKSREVSICPVDLKSCPIQGATGVLSDVECLDIAAELTSCGGCASTGEGQDCTTIEGAHSVECAQSKCIVHTCNTGYTVSADGASCVSA